MKRTSWHGSRPPEENHVVYAALAEVARLKAALHLMARDYLDSEGKTDADTTFTVESYVERAKR